MNRWLGLGLLLAFAGALPDRPGLAAGSDQCWSLKFLHPRISTWVPLAAAAATSPVPMSGKQRPIRMTRAQAAVRLINRRSPTRNLTIRVTAVPLARRR